jgi:hypothetical protein
MVATPPAAADTVSAVLEVGKAVWKLGLSLSNVNQQTQIANTTIKNLAAEVKLLGDECDLIYVELEEVINKSRTSSTPPYDVHGRIWNCLATQTEEISRTMQELELFVKSIKAEKSSFNSKAQSQGKPDEIKDQIASLRTKVYRHTDNLRTTLLLLNT